MAGVFMLVGLVSLQLGLYQGILDKKQNNSLNPCSLRAPWDRVLMAG